LLRHLVLSWLLVGLLSCCLAGAAACGDGDDADREGLCFFSCVDEQGTPSGVGCGGPIGEGECEVQATDSCDGWGFALENVELLPGCEDCDADCAPQWYSSYLNG
jgi:hypothetical protein